MFSDYDDYDALGLAELVRSGQVTPLELVEEAIGRIEAANPAINAVIYKMYDQARAAAQSPLPDGPFSGVPFLIKDLGAMVAGVPQSSGTRLLKEWVPPVDGELVRRWKAAGLIVLGKTNTPELGITPYTEPLAFGPTRNPYDIGRISGGSSGGSAAAVAAGMVHIASGGDGGGSIRIPAACCGLFGFKPTRGRTPMGPRLYESWEGLVVEHVLTRSVRDSAAALDATAGADSGAPYAAPPAEGRFLDEVGRAPRPLRIAYTSRALIGAPVNLHSECRRGLENTLHLLESLGHTVEEAAPQVEAEALAVAFILMLTGQVANDIAEIGEVAGRKPKRSNFELITWTLGMIGRSISGADYVRGVRTLQYAARAVGRFFDDYDVLVTPTVAEPPPPTGSLQLGANDRRLLQSASSLGAGRLLVAANAIEPIALKSFSFIPYTPLFNITGQPAMSVPLHWTPEGLPVGIQFAGRFGDEATLFRLAGQLEQARPWAGHRPLPAASLPQGVPEAI